MKDKNKPRWTKLMFQNILEEIVFQYIILCRIRKEERHKWRKKSARRKKQKGKSLQKGEKMWYC
jgi:hypothetical protein